MAVLSPSHVTIKKEREGEYTLDHALERVYGQILDTTIEVVKLLHQGFTAHAITEMLDLPIEKVEEIKKKWEEIE